MSFFDRSPIKVARDLVGKQIKVGRVVCTILEALPRTETDNARWLRSKPLFGDNLVDVYVSQYRSARLLFLRTAPDTCVRIDKVSVAGEVIDGPGRICAGLGIKQEKTGDLEFDGRTVTIRWHRKPRIKAP